jgi:hypothetical protein
LASETSALAGGGWLVALPPRLISSSPPSIKTCALAVLTVIRVPPCTLSAADDYRQVVSQVRPTPPIFSEMARLLAYLFLLARMDCS